MASLSRRVVPLLLALVVGGGTAGIGTAGIGTAQSFDDTLGVSDRQVRTLVVQGLTAASIGDHQTAADRFRAALDRAPGTPSLLSALSDAQASLGDTTTALYYARQARDRAPQRRHYHRRLGTLHRDAGRLRAATETYRRLLDRFPDATGARLALARTLANRNQPRAALRAYEAAVEASAHPRPSAYEAMVPLYRRTQDSTGLETALRRLVELQREPVRHRRLLARLYAEQGRTSDAIHQLEALRRVRPSDPEVLSQLRRLYRETGRPDADPSLATDADSAAPSRMLVGRARSLLQSPSAASDSARYERAHALLRRALRPDSTNVDALDLLAHLQRRRGAPANALATYQRALDTDPRAPERWRQAAAAALAADRPATAARLADEGLLLFPGRYELARLAARAHLRQGDAATARQRYRTATEGLPASADRAALYAGLGRAESRLGHYAAADSAFRRALRADPEHPAALNGYARSLARRNARLDQALAMAKRATAQDAANPSYLDTLGWIYLRRGAPQEAASVLRRALDLGAPSAALLEHYGDAQAALGNDAAARTYWQKALDQAPDRTSVRRKLDMGPE